MKIPTLFIDRDGTLIEEPPNHQVDTLSKIRFMPGVFAALTELTRRGYQFAMVTNQDGLGSEFYPRAAFDEAQGFILEAFRSQGIRFDGVFVCPHDAAVGCSCRKPAPGLVEAYIGEADVDLSRSAVIGDRTTDLELAANLGVRGFRVRRHGTPEETWPQIVTELLSRRAYVERETKETRVKVRVNLDSPAPPVIRTGVAFFDHMLEQFATHGAFALELRARGDLEVDEHHTVEDSALALGEALRTALGEKLGVARYGFLLPMDEAEAAVVIDLSGRPFMDFQGHFNRVTVGQFPTELVPHFFRSLADSLRATIHVSVKGENAHHMIEACFKGLGRSLRQAIRLEGRGLPSTKGVL
jgi:imidazoleglycerol-phosphate dehydratase / histidinol-phosphatase